jgi:putative ABC transport system permease protein
MLRSHFKIAFRNLVKSKGYALLNIFGLAIGITCCLLIFQYVSHEKSYDTFHDKADQIVRLRLDFHEQGKLTMQSAAVFPGLAPRMKKDFPEVENFCRLVDARISWSNSEPAQHNMVFSNDANNIKALENKGYYADPSVLNMFTIPFIEGDPGTALDGPGKMVISEKLGKKYFGQEDPVGKKLTIREGGQVYFFEITGIFKNYPENSHLVFDYLMSYKSFINLIHALGKGKEMDPDNSLGWYDFYAYLQLRSGTDWKKLDSKLPAFCDRYLNSRTASLEKTREDIYLIPLKDIHLYSHYNEEAEVNADGRSVSFLFLVAFFIIGIAWINYTNLATVRSLERAREVGVRKVLGAVQIDLISQFLVESFLLNLLALVLAIGIAFLVTPYFNRLIGRETITGFHLPGIYLKSFISLFLGGAFISGIYPAFVLSGYHPAAVLKGLFKNSGKGLVLRKALIIGQFSTSIFLIAGTIIVYQQVRFMRNHQLGANIEQTLVLEGAGSIQNTLYKDSFQPFKNELLQINGVKNITASSSVMSKEIYFTSSARLVGSSYKGYLTFYFIYMDYDFIPAYGMEMKEGRNFSKDFPTDIKAVILNEEAVKLLGLTSPSKAINQSVEYYGDSLKIIGVVANYHHMGLNRAITPIIFMLRPEAGNFYSIKFQTPDIHQTLASIENVWNTHFPADPFSYFFLDESFDHQYKADSQFGIVFGFFAFLAILIACFGLLSLSAYNVMQRTKEIGIRKILGASVQNLLFLLSKDFLLLVIIAFVIAIPVIWLVMDNWLQDFAYRIHISWWVFGIAGVISGLIALVTVGFQAFKAAIASPIRSLRSE